MKHLFLSLTLLISLCACTGSKPPPEIKNTASLAYSEKMDSLAKNVRFTITAQYSSLNHSQIEVTGHLYNTNDSAICFLTTTCGGDQDWLKYDTTQLLINRTTQCNAMYPMRIEIKPDSDYTFKASFVNKNTNGNLEMGFYFYPLECTQSLEFMTVADCSALILAERNLIVSRTCTIAAYN